MSSQLFSEARSTLEAPKLADFPWAPLKPVKRMVRVMMEIPIDDVDWSSCTKERDSIATDRGDEPVWDVDISLATYQGAFVEFDHEDGAIDYFLEEVK